MIKYFCLALRVPLLNARFEKNEKRTFLVPVFHDAFGDCFTVAFDRASGGAPS